MKEEHLEGLISLAFAKPFLGREFLIWLWHEIETQNGSIRCSDGTYVEMWIDDKIILEATTQSEARTNQIQGGNPSRSKEALIALQSGKLPKEIKFGLRNDQREWVGTVRTDNATFKGIKLPQVLVQPEEKLIERIALIEEFQETMNSILTQFLDKRLEDDWQSVRSHIGDWIDEGRN